MKNVKVKAVFKGFDGSCGYKTNQEYTLVISHKFEHYIQIENCKGRGYCEYGSILVFLENWDNIQKV